MSDLSDALARLRGIAASEGPWRLSRAAGTREPWDAESILRENAFGETELLAIISGGDQSGSSGEPLPASANAQLAALAPLLRDLLAGKRGALELLQRAADSGTSSCCGALMPGDTCVHSDCEDFLAAATEALETAMGTPPSAP